MKIGLDLDILERGFPTGVERAWRCLVRALLQREDGVRYVLYSRDPLDLGAPLPKTAQPVALGGKERTSLWRETRLAPALRQDGVDLLHSPVAAIPLRTQVPRVATVHEIPWLRHPGIEGAGREIVHRLRVRAAAAFAAAVVVPSEATRRDLASLHPGVAERTRVVPHGVDPLFLAAAAEGGEPDAGRLGTGGRPFLLAVGAGRPRKGPDTLLAAYARYREAGGDRDLVVTGPGKPPPGPPPGVRWVGWIEDPLLLAAYRGADALVYHSLNEGFGLPLLEAMATGTPVVAAAAGSVPEVAGEAALLVPPGDEAALAASLAAVTGDAALRERLRAAGRARAGEFPWARAAERVVEVWREVVGGARRPADPASSKRA
ncbi:MAG: glycosyltransferase family 4 protein [Planctomycetes bacterium]|nr:glycosyltransferase family 4 protein [Planctomycetota bacterium]